MAVDPRDFRFNSDYVTDYVAFATSGSFQVTLSSYGTASKTITHSLPFTPLPGGYWSLSSTFTTAYGFGANVYPAPNSSEPSVIVRSTSSGLILSVVAPYIASGTRTYTIYYRLYCLDPGSSAHNYTPSTTEPGNFMVDTDYNYMKLYQAGEFIMSSAESAFVVSHNFGYVPCIDCWADLGSGIEPIVQIQLGTVHSNVLTPAVEVSTTTFKINPVDATIFYRIYYDEA